MYVLRDATKNRALHVSYTEEGLHYAQSNYGKWIWFKDAELVRDYKGGYTYFKGDLSPNPAVYSEKFIPRDGFKYRDQITEFAMTNRALRLLYNNESIL